MSEVFKSIVSEIDEIGSQHLLSLPGDEAWQIARMDPWLGVLQVGLTNATYASQAEPNSLDLTCANLEAAIQKIIKANRGLRGEQL